MAHQPREDEELKAGCGLIVYEDDDTSGDKAKEKEFLNSLLNETRRIYGQIYGRPMEVNFVKRSKVQSVSKYLEQCQLDLNYNKVIVAFPDKQFYEGQLVETINTVMKRGLDFVVVIMHQDQFEQLPVEVQEFNLRWIRVNIQMQEMESYASDLVEFLSKSPKTVDLAFLNAGTGLAWSYYFGYLWYILPEFVENITTSTWRKNNASIPDDRISKTMFIVFSTNCREPAIMNSDRIIFNINKHPIYRAGLRRPYDFDIREVKSRNGKESYYGVVYHLNILQALTEMRDDQNKLFINFSEENLRKQGRYCFEKLKLFLKHTYNEKINIDSSRCEFIEFNSEAENADEYKLADELFNRLKQSSTDVPAKKTPVEETGGVDTTGVLYLDNEPLSADVRDFIDQLDNKKEIFDCKPSEDREEFGLRLIRESRNIFMVLTDEFVKTNAFEKWFYVILDKGYEIRNRRFLVCLNCLSQNIEHPRVLELQLLFTSIKMEAGWPDQVSRELQGDKRPLVYDLQFNNIGTGLCLSWYFRYLKIRLPKLRDVIYNCEALRTKFENHRMSHKVFILHPHSCHSPDKVSDVDPGIKLIDDKEINLPRIMKDTRDYTPKVYCITDADGKEYYAFVEFNTQAETMYRMREHGFLRSDMVLASEWDRFCNKLYTLLNHPQEPMDCRNRMQIIRYDDSHMAEGDLSADLFRHVAYEIAREQAVLPNSIDNGATIEHRDWEKTTKDGAAPTAVGGAEGGNAVGGVGDGKIKEGGATRGSTGTCQSCLQSIGKCFTCCGARNKTDEDG